jgi:hypothetical protein
MCELHHLDRGWAQVLARGALEAAAPILAEAIARKILTHMYEREPEVEGPDRDLRRAAWRNYFHTAAHIAKGLPVCANCARPIERHPKSATGWWHKAPSPVEGWQGIRCPGMLCGATPAGENASA